MADYFTPRAPQSFTIVGGTQVCISQRTSDRLYIVLYITNNSNVPVYLGFTGPKDTVGNAAVNHGITVFPESTFVFDDPVPLGCSIWATCKDGDTAIVGVQQ